VPDQVIAATTVSNTGAGSTETADEATRRRTSAAGRRTGGRSRRPEYDLQRRVVTGRTGAMTAITMVPLFRDCVREPQ